MVKSYLKYVPGPILGQIGSRSSSILTYQSELRHFCVVSALENIFLWDLKLSTLSLVFHGNKFPVCSFNMDLSHNFLSVGYSDGEIKVWRMDSRDCICNFYGHNSAIKVLTFSPNGLFFASGGIDCNIILWDVINCNGIAKLKGHQMVITNINFISENVFVSSSKDRFLKIWDISTRTCFQTITEHPEEVLSTIVISGKYLISSCRDDRIRFFIIVPTNDDNDVLDSRKIQSRSPKISDFSSLISFIPPFSIKFVGILENILDYNTSKLIFDDKSLYLAARSGQIIKFYEVSSKISTHLNDLSTLIEYHNSLKISDKTVDFDFLIVKNCVILTSILSINQIDIFRFGVSFTNLKKSSLSLFHHDVVKSIHFSSDSQFIVTGSTNELQIWNPYTEQVLTKFQCNGIVACYFLPGERYIVYGTSLGLLHIYDLHNLTIFKTIDLHSDRICCLQLNPISSGITVCSSDGLFKFVDIIFNPNDTDNISMKERSSHVLNENVLTFGYSPNGNLIAVALLDNTVRIYFVFSMKNFLCLYGHHLPVLTLEISHDSHLIATGSADKSIKIWELEFGNCIRSFLYHSNAVLSVRFIPNSHELFSSSRDNSIKYFDLDSAKNIFTLFGHHDSVCCLAISPDGKCLASSSVDMSIRIWNQSAEILFEIECNEEKLEDINGVKIYRSIKQISHPLLSDESKFFDRDNSIDYVLLAEKIEELIQSMTGLHNSDDTNYSILYDSFAKPSILYSHGLFFEFLKYLQNPKREEILILLSFQNGLSSLFISMILVQYTVDIETLLKSSFYLLRMHKEILISNLFQFLFVEKLKIIFRTVLFDIRRIIGFNVNAIDKMARNQLSYV